MARLLYALLCLLLLAWHAFGQQPTYTVQNKLPKYTVENKAAKADAKAEDSGVVTYSEVVMLDAQGRPGLYLKPSKDGHPWYFKGYMAARPLTRQPAVGYTLPTQSKSGST